MRYGLGRLVFAASCTSLQLSAVQMGICINYYKGMVQVLFFFNQFEYSLWEAKQGLRALCEKHERLSRYVQLPTECASSHSANLVCGWLSFVGMQWGRPQ